MADNIADVVLPAGWVSAYTVSGIAQGKGLIIQNKSDIFVLGYQVGPQPSADDVNGYLIAPLATVIVDGTSPNYWLRGSGRLFIQEV